MPGTSALEPLVYGTKIINNFFLQELHIYSTHRSPSGLNIVESVIVANTGTVLTKYIILF